MKRAHELAQSAVDALNSLYAAPSKASRCHRVISPHVAEVHKYIFDCCYEFAVAPSSADASAPHSVLENEDDTYDVYNSAGATDLVSDMVALPAEGGNFPVALTSGRNWRLTPSLSPLRAMKTTWLTNSSRGLRARAIGSPQRSTLRSSLECAMRTWPSSSLCLLTSFWVCLAYGRLKANLNACWWMRGRQTASSARRGSFTPEGTASRGCRSRLIMISR